MLRDCASPFAPTYLYTIPLQSRRSRFAADASNRRILCLGVTGFKTCGFEGFLSWFFLNKKNEKAKGHWVLSSRLKRALCCFSCRFTRLLLRKEVIQPHLPVRLPCYDFTPLTRRTLDASFPYGLSLRLRVPPTRVV